MAILSHSKQKLIRMNNFHSCYAIYCALHTASLQRLKLTWEKVPKKYTNILKDLSVLFDQRQNYSAYRAAIAAARPPVVPYMSTPLLKTNHYINKC